MKKSWVIVVVVLAVGGVMWSCSRPAMMPARHLEDTPQAPGNSSTSSNFIPAEDQKDKVIKDQAELIRLYEMRVKELEAKLLELGVNP